MREPIRMPALSDTMKTGVLHQWLKKPGDPIHKGEAIAEVESDKAVMELEAFRDGVLAGPLAKPGSELPVGTVIGYVADSAEEAAEGPPAEPAAPPPAGPPAGAPPKPPGIEPQGPSPAGAASPAGPRSPEPPPPPLQETPTPPPAPAGPAPEAEQRGTPRVSPYARALARDLNLDLAAVPPGPDGVIHAAEVIAAALAGPQPRIEPGPPYRYKLLTPMHRAVAENMAATVYTPTFRVGAQVDLGPLHRYAHEQQRSFTLLLSRACALTITEHPRFNAVYTPRALLVRERVDVGIAVDLPGGLVTPVLRDMAKRPLDELAEDWRILRDKARRGRLQPADYQGATFYVSNLGMFPAVTRFAAIVPLGAAAILAIGAAHGGYTELTLSCDHRVVFGADAARFLGTLAERLAAPEAL
ncbi:MAG TPA: 2-oxo acid dehydrogenase subunit E2 [Chromatiales bacterium]|nr:2-oxo acid dehydrogenase subunit E2 [Chromatiales bacterium]